MCNNNNAIMRRNANQYISLYILNVRTIAVRRTRLQCTCITCTCIIIHFTMTMSLYWVNVQCTVMNFYAMVHEF